MAEISYKLVEGWEKLPANLKHLDCVGAGVDANDRVYLITRSDSRVIVYEQDGTFVAAWGEGVFTPRTHCIRFGPDGAVYTVDDGNHTVRKFTPDGKQLMILGTPGVATDTGYVKEKGISSITAWWSPLQPSYWCRLAPQTAICMFRTATATPASIVSAPTASLFNPGESQAPGLASSTCPTTSGWLPTSAFSWLTGRTIESRSSASRASSSNSGPTCSVPRVSVFVTG